MMRYYNAFLLCILLSLITSCANDKLEVNDLNCDGQVDVTYTNDVAAIINGSCAYVNCHAGDQTPDLSDYEKLSTYLSTKVAKFKSRTFEQRDMPPAEDVVDPFPSELTEDQITLLRCWIEDGYPE